MKILSRLPLWTVVLLLAACGDDSPSLERRVSVANAGLPETVVCLDINLNLACDADEPQARLDGDRIATISTRAEDSPSPGLWLAEMRSSGAADVSLRLLAPGSSSRIDGLSSLVAATWLTGQASGLEAAVSDTAYRLGLQSSAGMLGAASEELAPPGISNLDTHALALWASGFSALLAKDGRPPSSVAAVQDLGYAVSDVLSRYALASDGDLLATVTSRTLVHEVSEALSPSSCEFNQPLLIRVDTKAGVPILSKEDYVDATLEIPASAEFGAAFKAATQIRGRGNSTWGMPKKPYRLKLAKKAPLLGMPEERDWALLANHADKSLLRNAVAFCLGQMLNMRYTPRWRAVELELNGAYQGVYQLVEHLETGAYRVDIGDDSAAGLGFLVEIDHRRDADLSFISPIGVPMAVKSDATPTQFDEMLKVFAALDAALFPNGFADAVGPAYRELLDAEAAVDFYLVNEFLRNNDAFFSSTFLTRKDNGKIAFGPLWDFDIAAGIVNYNGNESPIGWYVGRAGAPTYNAHIVRLLQDPVFARHVQARWAFLSRRVPALLNYVRTGAATLGDAQARNFGTWDILGTWQWPNAVVTGSYSGEVDYLHGWLQQRAIWMDQQMTLVN